MEAIKKLEKDLEETKKELNKYKKLARFQYLTLGFYASDYNYQEKSAVTWVDNSKILGILRDSGQQAKEALDYLTKNEIKPEEFL